jgi:hypothetical protein
LSLTLLLGTLDLCSLCAFRTTAFFLLKQLAAQDISAHVCR